MGKRKNTEDDAERIKRKLKKWQKRLKKTEENAGSTDSAEGTPPRPVPDDLEGVIEDNETAVTIPDVEEAPEELLLALGPEGGDTSETGEPILQTLASRWQNIMRDGLNKETKEQIIKKYPAPLNFAITAPALNPEIKATLSDSALKRDNRIIWRQNQMTKVLSAIGRPLTNIMKGSINSKELVEQLNNAAKLAADLFYQDTIARKYFALSTTTTVVREAIKKEKADELLFGQSCAEKIRSAQSIQRTGAQIKQKQKNFKSPLQSQQTSRSGPYQQPRYRTNQQSHRQPGRPQQRQQYKKKGQQRKRSSQRNQQQRN